MKGGKGDGRARDGKTFSHSILLISTTAHNVHIIRTGDIIYISHGSRQVCPLRLSAVILSSFPA